MWLNIPIFASIEIILASIALLDCLSSVCPISNNNFLFNRSLGDKSYLVEKHVKIPKEKLHESIPYKYAVYKHSKKELIYEAIYQEEKNDYINRCLSIKQGLLTREGILNSYYWYRFCKY